MSVLNRIGTILGLTLVLLVAVAIGAGYRALNAPLSVPDGGYTMIVPAGSSLQSLAERLSDEGILASPRTLTWYGRITGEAAQVKAGEYDVLSGTTALQLLDQLVRGRVRLHALTIVEGWTVRDLLRAIRKHPAIRQTLPRGDAARLGEALKLPSSSPEGWFFPDTYRFPRNTTDLDVLARAHTRMALMLEQAWSRRHDNLPLKTAYEALILASIIEKETALDRERTQIAGVFIRRLAAGMKLQTDPTVIYGLGDNFDGNLTRRHLAQDGPYNTYARAGLPPSPISLPGAASLLAAVQPDDSKALYFVASGNDDGSHVFSRTLKEHNAAVRRYLEISRNASE